MTSVLLSRIYSTYGRSRLASQCRLLSVSCCRNQQSAKVKQEVDVKTKQASASKRAPSTDERESADSPPTSGASASASPADKSEKLVYQESPAAFPPPTAEGEPATYSPKILKLIDEIANLTLVEVADLNKALKKKLNLPDAPMFAASVPMVAAAAAQSEDAESAPAVAATKTRFAVKLTKIDDSKKIALIKEIKAIIPSLNLVQAKKFVETVPQIVKSDLLKDEADKLVERLSALGAACEAD